MNQSNGFMVNSPTGQKGVLVLHAWWGLNNTIKDFCTKLGNNGYTTFAPDLYHGQVADDPESAQALSGTLFKRLDPTRQEVSTAADYLYEQCGRPEHGLAVLGFSLGAFFALDV